MLACAGEHAVTGGRMIADAEEFVQVMQQIAAALALIKH